MPDISPAASSRPALCDERGASILLALFYFLVCAVVGAVVLTAATVTTGQLVALERSQQAYYSVTSAAELLRDSIVDGTCSSSGAEPNREWTCALRHPAGQKDKAALEQWLATMTRQATGGAAPTSTFSVSFGADSDPVRQSVLKVQVTATMKADYSLHFTLRPEEYTEPVGEYRVTLDIPAALLYGVDEKTPERVTWERAIIGKPLQAEGGAGA
ncbi:hypothetical protein [Arabiibacter massiliensis]|uniref:hypothetical protein n=1 Tax=Arabiibacter massiliensis TaxID=1870985 RepID=UPI00117B96A9|nr:hypothetical protein [Arabiibacter massiliensis]